MLEKILSTSIRFEIEVGIAIAILAVIMITIASLVMNKLTKDMDKRQKRVFSNVVWLVFIGSFFLGIALRWAAVSVT